MTAWRVEYSAPGNKASSGGRLTWREAADFGRGLLEAARPEGTAYTTLVRVLKESTPDKAVLATDGKHTLRLFEIDASADASAEPAHADRAHSELGASSCERWWNCPGSVAASRGMPNRSSPAAELGTAAHEVAELCLRNGQDALEYVGRTVNGIEIDAHTADKVQKVGELSDDQLKALQAKMEAENAAKAAA